MIESLLLIRFALKDGADVGFARLLPEVPLKARLKFGFVCDHTNNSNDCVIDVVVSSDKITTTVRTVQNLF